MPLAPKPLQQPYPPIWVSNNPQRFGFNTPSIVRAMRRIARLADGWMTAAADAAEYRVFNQFTEVFNVADLAEKVRHAAGELGIEVQVDHVTNPRLELEEHYYNPTHTKLLALGLQPTLLSETLIESMLEVIRRYQDRVLVDVIDPVTQWRPEPLGQPAQ